MPLHDTLVSYSWGRNLGSVSFDVPVPISCDCVTSGQGGHDGSDSVWSTAGTDPGEWR